MTIHDTSNPVVLPDLEALLATYRTDRLRDLIEGIRREGRLLDALVGPFYSGLDFSVLGELDSNDEQLRDWAKAIQKANGQFMTALRVFFQELDGEQPPF